MAVTRDCGAGSSRARSRPCSHELSHIANRDVLIMAVASFFAMCAAMLTRIAMYSGMVGGGRDRDLNGPPIWLIVTILTYALSYVLIAGRPRRVTPSAGPG